MAGSELTETKIASLIVDFMVKRENGNWHFDKTKRSKLHGSGPDLTLIGGKRSSEYFTIECKSKSEAESADSINKEGWVQALGQLVTRMNVERFVKSRKTGKISGINRAYKYGLGLYWVGAQKALARIPKPAAKILNLYVFSVNDSGEVRKFTPKDFGRKYEKEDFL